MLFGRPTQFNVSLTGRAHNTIRAYSQPHLVGFTLFELLIVMALIVLLAGTATPAIRSLSRPSQIASASRQVIDHLLIARSLAISGRRVVYVVFVPARIGSHYQAIVSWRYPSQQLRQQDLNLLTNLVLAQCRAYAFFSPRSVGDQPGRPMARYIGDWRRLPDGTFFLPDKFQDLGSTEAWLNLADNVEPSTRPLLYGIFPFPSEYGPPLRLPFIAFDPFGRLYYPAPRIPRYVGEELVVTRGSVFYPRDQFDRVVLTAVPSFVEIEHKDGTGRARIFVDWITGKATSKESLVTK